MNRSHPEHLADRWDQQCLVVPSAVPLSTWQTAWRWAQRRPRIAALIGLCGVLLVAGVPYAIACWLSERTPLAARWIFAVAIALRLIAWFLPPVLSDDAYRYRWEGPGGERVRTILQFGSVIGVQARRLRPGVKDAVLELLTLSFQPQQAPGGLISLQFAGDGDLQVAVECIDAIMADVSAPWPTPRRPQHEA